MPTIEIPIFDKLPQTLMGDTFTLNHVTDQMAYYLFHDKLWMADHRHMLGWAREAKHSLEQLNPAQSPDWIFGHAFRKSLNRPNPNLLGSFKWGQGTTERMENLNIQPVYELSGETDVYNKLKMIFMCDGAIRDLELAGVTIDQWGAHSTPHWLDHLVNHIDAKHPIAEAALKVLSPLQFHTVKNNHSNSIHHPEYPVKPNG